MFRVAMLAAGAYLGAAVTGFQVALVHSISELVAMASFLVNENLILAILLALSKKGPIELITLIAKSPK
jgi:hypothetical protein